MGSQIVVINGTGGSGKDEFVKMCQGLVNTEQQQRVFNVSSIDPIKNMLIKEGLWDGVTKNEQTRALMHHKKMAVLEQDPNFINALLLRQIQELEEIHGTDELVFVHIREIDQIESFRNFVGNAGYETSAIHFSRPGVAVTENRGDADTALYREYAFHIDNDGTLDDLRKTADHFLVEMNIKSERDLELMGESKLHEGNPPLDIVEPEIRA